MILAVADEGYPKIIEPSTLLSDWEEVYANNSEEKIACYSLDSVSTLEAKLAKMKDDIGVECILTGFSGGSRYQPVVRYWRYETMTMEDAILTFAVIKSRYEVNNIDF